MEQNIDLKNVWIVRVEVFGAYFLHLDVQKIVN